MGMINPIKDQSLHVRRKHAKRKLPADARKIGPRTEEQETRAIRSILRGKYGGYEVFTPMSTACSPEDAIEDLQLQNNALALTVSELMRKMDNLSRVVAKLKGASLVEIGPDSLANAATPMAEVIPISAKPKGSKQQQSPLAVPGNEAEDLSYQEQQTLPVSRQGHRKLAVVQSKELAANDAIAEAHRVCAEVGNETDVVVSDNMDVVPIEDSIEDYALTQFSWTENEARSILYREYVRRDHNSRKTNGLSYDDVRLKRMLAQKNAVGFRHLVYYIDSSEIKSGFGEFFRRTSTESYIVKAKMLAHDTTEHGYINQMFISEHIKAGAKVSKQRDVNRLKYDKLSRAGILNEQHRKHNHLSFAAVDSKAHESRSVWQWSPKWKATKLGWKDSIGRWKKRLGLKAKEVDVPPVPVDIVLKPDRDAPLSSLVREANRAGIGY